MSWDALLAEESERSKANLTVEQTLEQKQNLEMHSLQKIMVQLQQ